MMAPWDEYVQAAKALFARDDDVQIELDEGDSLRMVVRVRGTDKAESMAAILPVEKTFGNVTMGIAVVPDNDPDLSVADHLRRAFAGNPALSRVLELAPTPRTFGATYALFAPEVAQYYTDNLQSPFGYKTVTIEELAREVLALPNGALVTSDEA